MTKAAELAKMGEVLTNSQIGGRRNIIINGAMQVAQRGTSASSKNTSDYFTCDRWRTEASGATYNTSQQTNSASDMATTGAEHFLRMEVTTGNNNSGISQKIEAQNIKQFKGEKLTLSFYAKGTNPNGGSFNLRRQFSDSVNPSATAEDTSFTVSSSWTKHTITFDYPNEGSVNLTLNTAKMALSFLQPESDTSTNAWTLDLTSVQLEVGSQATPFEHLSFGETLALAQRYYTVLCEQIDGGGLAICNMAAYSSSILYGVYNFPTEMRAHPTLEQVTGTNNYRFYRNGGNDYFNQIEIDTDPQNTRNAELHVDQDLSHTAGHAGWIRSGNENTFVAFDAEF